MAISLQEFRQQYPEYKDMSDDQLVRAAYQQYYADAMPFNEFAEKIGYQMPDPMGIQQPSAARQFWDNSVGELEVAGTIGSSIVAEPLAGIAGIAQSLNPWADEGAGARAVEGVRDTLTYKPQTEAGERKLQSVAGVLEPVGKAMEWAEKGLGDSIYNATGSPALATAGTMVPTAAMEALGVGLGKGLSKVKRATPENVRTELSRLGLPGEQLSDVEAQRIADALNESGDFSGEGLVGTIEDIEAPGDWVPKTRAEQHGIDTNDFSLWRKQNEAAAGNYGDDAERAVNDFTDMRERQLGKVLQNQMDDLGPTKGANSSAGLASDLYDGILAKVDEAKRAKSEAYKNVEDIAAERGPMMAGAEVMDEALQAAYRGFDGKVKLASKKGTPNAYELYEELQAAMRGEKVSDLPGALAAPDNSMQSLDNFEHLRRRIQAAERAAERGSADELLLGQVRRQFDEWLDDAVESGKFHGDPEQLAALKEARKLNREYMQIIKGTYKDGKPTARTKIINDVVNGRSTPEQVVNQIIGSSGKKQGAKIAEDFKRLFGEDSPEFGALRQSAFLNIFGNAIKVADDGTLRLSKGNYINRLSDQLKNNETNLRALFSEDEVHRWNKFAGELKKLQEDVRKKNFSGTAYHVHGALQKIAQKLDLITLSLATSAVDGGTRAWNWRSLRKYGLAEGDFTVSSDAAKLIGALVPGGVNGMREQDKDERPVGVLAE